MFQNNQPLFSIFQIKTAESMGMIILLSLFTSSLSSPTNYFYGSHPDQTNLWANQNAELSRYDLVILPL